MSDTPTPRLELPAPIGSDPAAVPKDIQALAKRLDDIVLAYGQGSLASRPTGTQGFLYFAIDTKTAYYCTAPGTWQSVTPLDAGGDLGGTWPTPAVAKLSSDNLPVHSGGSRRLARQEFVAAPAGTTQTVIGALDHRGADVTMVVTVSRGGVQGTVRYGWSVAPLPATGWRVLQPVAISRTLESVIGGSVKDVAAAILVDCHALERSGKMHVGVRVSTPAEPVVVSVSIDASGNALSWGASSEPFSVTTLPAPWTSGGPVGPPRVANLPASPYGGQEIDFAAGQNLLVMDGSQSQTVPVTWRLRYVAERGMWQYVTGPPLARRRSERVAAKQGDLAPIDGGAPCTVTVPLRGYYTFEFGAGLAGSDVAGVDGLIGVYEGPLSNQLGSQVGLKVQSISAGAYPAWGVMDGLYELNAGAVVGNRFYKTDSGTGWLQLTDRALRVTPRWVR